MSNCYCFSFAKYTKSSHHLNERETPEPTTTAKSKSCEQATTVAREPPSIRRVVFPSPSHSVPPQCCLIAGVKKGNPRRRRFAIIFSPSNPPCRRCSKKKFSRCLQSSQPLSTAAVLPEYLDKKIFSSF
ncbi:hypothetical protein V8G54_018926 [Vigna mungo]|uniref:Uncharacterized protein n=1 Tax=Vigna mungo TaxID=3915 RepID=A0AAQ3N900_VIGMU